VNVKVYPYEILSLGKLNNFIML